MGIFCNFKNFSHIFIAVRTSWNIFKNISWRLTLTFFLCCSFRSFGWKTRKTQFLLIYEIRSRILRKPKRNLKNFKLLLFFGGEPVTNERTNEREKKWRREEEKKLIKNSAFKFSFFIVVGVVPSGDNWRCDDLCVLIGRMYWLNFFSYEISKTCASN